MKCSPLALVRFKPLVTLSVLAGFVVSAQLNATTIPSAALLKSQVGGTGPYVFNAQGSGTSVIVDPTIAISASGQPYDNPTGDASKGLQNAICLIASASGGNGGTIFLKPGIYTLTKTIRLKGTGIQIVGVKDSEGNYPTLQYTNALVDCDYDNRETIENNTAAVLGHQAPITKDPCASPPPPPPAAITGAVGPISVLEHPAVIRILGNDDYGPTNGYSYEGLIGINIVYVNSGSGDGATATGIALQGVHECIVRDIVINGAYNGLDLGAGNSPFFRNISIINIPDNAGSFGANLGPYDVLGSADTNGIKVHGLTVTGVTGNTHTALVTIPGNTQVVGALIQNGGIGVEISGNPGTASYNGGTIGPIPADDVYLRSIEVDNVAQQGVLLDHAQECFLLDVTINHAAADALEATANYYTGLTVTNLTTTYAGYNGVHIYNGLNVNFANAVIHNSNQGGHANTGGITIEAPVTSFNVSGAEIGSVSGTTAHERQGIRYNGTGTGSTASTGPWMSPQTILATYVNFLTLDGSEAVGITPTNVGSYSTLTAAGYFSPPDSTNWSIQELADDPAIPTSGPLAVVRGFNAYDLTNTVRNAQWVDLTLIGGSGISPVVTLTAVDPSDPNSALIASFDSLSYYFHYWEGIAETQFGNSGTTPLVLYLPAGHFTFNSSGVPTVWIPISDYQLTERLLVDQANIQLLGDGRGVTQLYNYASSGTANNDNAIKLYTGSDGSGIFGLSVMYSKAALFPCPAVTSPVQTYLPAILVTGTSKVRLADVEVDYSLGGAISVVDTLNSEFYSIIMGSMGVNNTQPSVNLAAFGIAATSTGQTQDIRLCQVYGTFAHNIWIASTSKYATDSHAGGLTPDLIPSLNWVQITGGAQRVQADYNTHLEGKNGLVALLGNDSGKPQHISATLFATDHVYVYGVDLECAAVNTDLVESWFAGGGQEGIYVSSGVTDSVRVSTTLTRSQEFEGIDLQGGSSVSLVNCRVGNNYNLGDPGATQIRPKGGVYLGYGISAAFVGGLQGWAGNIHYSDATHLSNNQDFGLVLGYPSPDPDSAFTIYGTDQTGNQTAPIGVQQSSTTSTTASPY
jgi:hypothetical protein